MIILRLLGALGLLLAGSLATGCAGTATPDTTVRRAAAEPSRISPSQEDAAEAYRTVLGSSRDRVILRPSGEG